MNNRKQTKRALLTSVMALVMCVVMLVGTTFAWFTDTATANVNKIQAGNLDVLLEMEDGTGWTDAEGQTLQFKKAGGTNQELLWEPGCTYELPKLRISNNGNLNLKYKVEITGINGSDKLNEAIEWTIINDGTPITTVGNEYALNAKADTTVDSDTLTISGHMKESAGNEYKNLSIDGVSITVYATQMTGEWDSSKNNYDENATYPASVAEIKAQYGVDGMKMPTGVEITNESDGQSFTITLKDEEAFIYFTQVFDRAAAYEARMKAWDAGNVTKYANEYNLSSLNLWYGAYCNKITLKMDCDVDLQGIPVDPFGFGGYVVNFDGNGHTIKNAKIAASTGDAGFFASRVNIKNVTLDNIHVSATGCNSAGVVAGAPNSLITNVTVKNSSVTGGKYTGAIAGYDYGDITSCTVENTTVTGQYKVGGIVGYICNDSDADYRTVTGNKLTNVTIKTENIWPGKESDGFVIGKIVGNWDATKGACNNNTFSGTTTATDNIGKIQDRAQAGLNQ